MDKSVYQARWLLAPILGLCVVIMTAGFWLG